MIVDKTNFKLEGRDVGGLSFGECHHFDRIFFDEFEKLSVEFQKTRGICK